MWHADRGSLLLRTPGPVPLGLAYVLIVETNPFTNLSLFYRTMLFEYPSVLSRFCFANYYLASIFTHSIFHTRKHLRQSAWLSATHCNHDIPLYVSNSYPITQYTVRRLFYIDRDVYRCTLIDLFNDVQPMALQMHYDPRTSFHYNFHYGTLIVLIYKHVHHCICTLIYVMLYTHRQKLSNSKLV